MDTVTMDQSGEAPTDAADAAGTSQPNGASNGAGNSNGTGNGAAETGETKAKRGRPRGQSSARKTRTVELTLTVTGTADGEWQAELVHGGKRVVTGLAIAASAVSRAAKELHPDIAGNIETVISAAREQHQRRAAELQAELEKVQAALAELES